MNQKTPYRFITKDGLTYFYVKQQIVGWYSFLSYVPDWSTPFCYFACFIPMDSGLLDIFPQNCQEWLIGSWEHYFRDIEKQLGDRNF